MNITLPREQQEWLEAQVKGGAYESVDAAISAIIAEYRHLGPDDLDWTIPLIEEGRASIERGEGIPLEEHLAHMQQLAKLKRR